MKLLNIRSKSQNLQVLHRPAILCPAFELGTCAELMGRTGGGLGGDYSERLGMPLGVYMELGSSPYAPLRDLWRLYIIRAHEYFIQRHPEFP